MFSLAAFVTQIIIFINQQDAHDDGHEVRDHFTAKEDGKKKIRLVPDRTVFAVQIRSRKKKE